MGWLVYLFVGVWLLVCVFDCTVLCVFALLLFGLIGCFVIVLFLYVLWCVRSFGRLCVYVCA